MEKYNEKSIDIENIDVDEEVEVFLVGEEDSGKRLDIFISNKYENISRTYIQKLIKDDRIFVNSKKEKSSYKLSCGEVVEISMPKPEIVSVKPQNINIEIVFEDEDILIVNKAQGMVVHPAPGNQDNTLVNAIMYHCKDRLSSINGVIRPGIVHRIDKMTSGLLVIAKNDKTHRHLADQFKIHSITREYEMVCTGNIEWDKKTVESMIGRNPKDRLKISVLKSGGRSAITHFEVVERYGKHTYLKATLETGRTHQIRVHAGYLRHPIVGDHLYGYKDKHFSKLEGQTLHARKLGFIHPRTEKYIEFNSDLPEYFLNVLNKVKKL